MRQGPNPKRSRRGRKPHNFLNRTFDSNGPDVKIRGTAAHIFEKYQALARDAHASGDRVGAENLLQHAEHYYRILNAYQTSQASNGGFNNGGGRPYPAQGDGSAQDTAQQGQPRSVMPQDDSLSAEHGGPEDGDDGPPFGT
jgi:hypothetical protein